VREIISGGQIIETCPSWCTATHEQDARGMLDDLVHVGPEVGMRFDLFDHWEDGQAAYAAQSILLARVQIDPYSTDPRRNRPHVLFEPRMDEPVECADREEFAAYIAQIRAHADHLEGVLAQLDKASAEHDGVTPAA
jgi:hypothetical protein